MLTQVWGIACSCHGTPVYTQDPSWLNEDETGPLLPYPPACISMASLSGEGKHASIAPWVSSWGLIQGAGWRNVYQHLIWDYVNLCEVVPCCLFHKLKEPWMEKLASSARRVLTLFRNVPLLTPRTLYSDSNRLVLNNRTSLKQCKCSFGSQLTIYFWSYYLYIIIWY